MNHLPPEDWRLYGKKADFVTLAEQFHISPVLARIIRNRDICSPKEIELYLHGTLSDLPDPHLMKDMDRAVSLLLSAAREQKPIRIVGDYDADGVCSIAILYRCLSSLNACVDWTIPDRIRDGYGLNMSFVEDAHRDGIELLLTCDNGIAALEPIAKAREYGMMTVITDHHELPEKETPDGTVKCVPAADAIVNPKQPDCHYPFSGICGAAISYYLSCLLLDAAEAETTALRSELLMYAAIATVTDVCDLQQDNRILVKEGLALLRTTGHPGLCSLMEYQSLDQPSISAYHLGFVIGPALNAGGRLETARTAVELLLSQDAAAAAPLAAHLKELNDIRKNMTVKEVEEAEAVIQEQHLDQDSVLVVFLPECHESLAGIIAGRIREAYGKPAIVLTRGKDGLKGSGRSIEAYHMFHGLVSCQEFLSKFGGHPMAAGLSLPEENLEAFRRAINERCNLTPKDLIPTLWIDVPLPFEYISPSLIHELSLLEPFGKANTKPIFADRNLRIVSMQIVGSSRNVVRLILENPSMARIDAVYFTSGSDFLEELRAFYGEEEVHALLHHRPNSIRINAAYYPSINTYRGNSKLQITLTRVRLKHPE